MLEISLGDDTCSQGQFDAWNWLACVIANCCSLLLEHIALSTPPTDRYPGIQSTQQAMLLYHSWA